MILRRRVCVVTGSRAEYGLLYWLMDDIRSDPTLELQVAVTGMHLSPAFGLTVREIERDEMPICARVDALAEGDDRAAMAKSLGQGVIGFAESLDRLHPDVLVVLGDRFEILAAAEAAALMGIPIAHISGGEVTEGAVDDWIRHAISKMAWWHFVAADPYKRRLIQLGEDPARVFNVGDPGLDSIRNLPLLDSAALAVELNLALASPLFLVTYHPATLGALPPDVAFGELLAALDQFPTATVVVTKPNADCGGHQLGRMAEDWAARRMAPTLCATSLGQLRYLSLMRHADVVIGNSSSGIVEAPALKTATVNVGFRQEGRLKADSIIDCEERQDAIIAAVRRALSREFQATLPSTVSLYGDSNASAQIKHLLATLPLPTSLAKHFHDL